MSADSGNKVRAKRPAPPHAWKKGQSGNPNGRPKVVEEFKAGCRRVVDEVVISMWEEEVRSAGPNWVRCSELLAAYAYGKPAQSVTVGGDANNPIRHEHVNLEALSDDELVTLATLRARAEAEKSAATEPH